jgi:5-methylcytosine-specific restriction endonuclease McrA
MSSEPDIQPQIKHSQIKHPQIKHPQINPQFHTLLEPVSALAGDDFANPSPLEAVTQGCDGSVLSRMVVVFSKNYLPLARINIKRAVVLLVSEQAEPLDFGGGHYWQVCSPSTVVKVPEHIRLVSVNPERHWKVPPVNRREVLKRDGHACQYCGTKKRLTLDHVVPRSKGGGHAWDNVVTACESCNSLKGARLLHETHLVLRAKPKAPIHPTVLFAEKFWHSQNATSA